MGVHEYTLSKGSPIHVNSSVGVTALECWSSSVDSGCEEADFDLG